MHDQMKTIIFRLLLQNLQQLNINPGDLSGIYRFILNLRVACETLSVPANADAFIDAILKKLPNDPYQYKYNMLTKLLSIQDICHKTPYQNINILGKDGVYLASLHIAINTKLIEFNKISPCIIL
jgi:hypothetical protein